jgi:hypothetical protein
MSRRLSPLVFVAGFVVLSACDRAGPEAPAPVDAAPVSPRTMVTPTAAADLPEAVRAVVAAARPDMIITRAELKEREGRRYYDVEGTMNGAELELDLLETPQGWAVVEIQRDIAWAETPEGVRAAARSARDGFTAVRVIESTQYEDGSIVYELFAAGQPSTPAMEVRVADGRAVVLKERWPH